MRADKQKYSVARRKFTDEQIVSMNHMRWKKHLSAREIAREFNCTQATVYRYTDLSGDFGFKVVVGGEKKDGDAT